MDAVLPFVFLAIMGLSLVLYVILDGYDLGIGLLLPLASDKEKDTMIAAIGPFWDANETWLVLGVGVLLIAFPAAHALVLTALYIPVTIMLFGLILLALLFLFRSLTGEPDFVWVHVLPPHSPYDRWGHLLDRLPPDVVNAFDDLPRVQEEWFGGPEPLDGLVHLGVNLRGMVQSDARVFHAEMETLKGRGLPVCIHASQTRPNSDDAADYERRGYLDGTFLFCHYVAATDSDRAAMANNEV